MIKRKDLIDRFSLIVKQEIKNHNDAIAASNKLANELKSKVNELDKAHQIYVSDHKQSMRDLKRSMTELQICAEGERMCLARAETSIARLGNKFDEQEARIKCFQASLEEISGQHADLKKTISIRFNSADERYEKLNASLQHQIDRLIKKQAERHQSFKQEIEEGPSRASDEIAQIRDCLVSIKADIQGLREDIANDRKFISYNGKKIEDLYTKLGRLKEKVSS